MVFGIGFKDWFLAGMNEASYIYVADIEAGIKIWYKVGIYLKSLPTRAGI
jgi:hypothetical protein